MTSARSLLSILAVAALASACDNDNDFMPTPAPGTPTPPTAAQFQIVHAVADAPSVDVTNSIATFVSGAEFKDVTGFLTVVEGTLDVQADANVPGGQLTVIPMTGLPIVADTQTTLIAAGEAGNGTIAPIVVTNPIAPIGMGYVRVEVVHAAPNAGDVDIYVTAPGADLGSEMPIAGGATPFGANSGQLDIPAGDYQIRITAPGGMMPVFDSGTVTLPAGASLLVIAVENTGPGNAPVTLLVADGTGSFEILAENTPAEVRVVHAVPDAPAVDVFVNDPMAAGMPALADLAFGEVQPGADTYADLDAGTNNVLVTVAGDPGVIAIPATDLDLAAGTQYTVYATGTLATIAPFITEDDDRPVATEARVRILHTAPSAGPVDIYVTAPGTDITTVAPAFTDVDFLGDTGYVSLAGGSYDVTVTPADSTMAVIGPVNVTFADGNVYTAAARDPNPAVMNDGFGLILLDDF